MGETFQESRKMGFQRNEYDWCVMNKLVKVKQCTIIWHVNDLNILDVDSDIVSSFLADIDAEHGNISKLP